MITSTVRLELSSPSRSGEWRWADAADIRPPALTMSTAIDRLNISLDMFAFELGTCWAKWDRCKYLKMRLVHSPLWVAGIRQVVKLQRASRQIVIRCVCSFMRAAHTSAGTSAAGRISYAKKIV